MIKRNDILTSPGFVISLSLLLANDFFLKPVFANPLTGKLSDFAGLFAFTLFWIAMFPGFRRLTCLSVALSFIFWKSSYSQPFIDLWNGLEVVRFSRTVDLTDLIAISVLPLAYSYASRKVSGSAPRSWAPASLALIAVFAFTATSFRTKYEDYGNKYYFAGPKSELFARIDYLRLDYFDLRLSKEEMESGELSLSIPSSMCFDSFSADLKVAEADNQTVVAIKKLQHRCPEGARDREELLAEFEKEFIERLKNGTAQTTHYKSKVETPGFSPPPVRVPSPLQASPGRAPGKF